MNAEVQLVWDAKAAVSECITLDERNDRLLFGDLHAGRIYALGLKDGARQQWDLPEKIGSFGICKSGRLVVAYRKYVVLFDPKTGKIDRLTHDIPEPAVNEFNDGKVGPDGCFWVGGRDGRALKHERLSTGALYRVTPDGRMEVRGYGYNVSNGLAWSPDGKTMYHSDSSGQYIDAYDFDAAIGYNSNRRRLVSFSSDADGRPDGATCDADGNYWSAAILAGRLNQFSPQGKLLQSITVPFPTPTMPGIVGDTMYITSMRNLQTEETLKKHPALGGLHKMKAPAKPGKDWLFNDA